MQILGEIIPKEGIGKIKLRDSKDSLIQLLGTPVRETVKKNGKLDLSYEGFCLRFDTNQFLESIEVYPGTRVSYKGMDVFDNAQAWYKLIEDEPDPLCVSGTLVLLSLGVSMWEDPREEEQDKSFVVSINEVWDRLKSKLKPYRKQS